MMLLAATLEQHLDRCHGLFGQAWVEIYSVLRPLLAGLVVMQLAVPGRDRHPGARLPRSLRAALAGHALAQIVFGAGVLLWTGRSDASLSSSSKRSALDRRARWSSKGGVSGIHPKTFAQVHKARAKAGVRCVGPSTPGLARAGPHGPVAPVCPRGARARTARLRLRARMRVRGRWVSSASVQSSWPRQRRGRPALLRPPSAERRRSGIPRPASERGSRPIRGAAR
jgi:hypothetical protein